MTEAEKPGKGGSSKISSTNARINGLEDKISKANLKRGCLVFVEIIVRYLSQRG